MFVTDVMTKDVVSLSKDATLNEAAEMMREYQVGSIVVVKAEKNKLLPVGVLTDRDIVVEVVAQNVDGRKLIVEDVMSRNIVTVVNTASLSVVIQIMEQSGIRRVPVVDEKGSLCGIITADDIASYLGSASQSLSKVPKIQRAMESQAQQWSLK